MKNFSTLVALLSLNTLETAEAVGLTPWEELEAGASRLLGISSKAKSNTQSDAEDTQVPHIDSDVAASGPSDMDDYFENNNVNPDDNDLDSVEDADGELDDSEDELNG